MVATTGSLTFVSQPHQSCIASGLGIFEDFSGFLTAGVHHRPAYSVATLSAT
jgi:hypothetical protein